MTVITVKGRGYFSHLNLTLKNDVFLQELNFANQKAFFFPAKIGFRELQKFRENLI